MLQASYADILCVNANSRASGHELGGQYHQAETAQVMEMGACGIVRPSDPFPKNIRVFTEKEVGNDKLGVLRKSCQ